MAQEQPTCRLARDARHRQPFFKPRMQDSLLLGGRLIEEAIRPVDDSEGFVESHFLNHRALLRRSYKVDPNQPADPLRRILDYSAHQPVHHMVAVRLYNNLLATQSQRQKI